MLSMNLYYVCCIVVDTVARLSVFFFKYFFVMDEGRGFERSYVSRNKWNLFFSLFVQFFFFFFQLITRVKFSWQNTGVHPKCTYYFLLVQPFAPKFTINLWKMILISFYGNDFNFLFQMVNLIQLLCVCVCAVCVVIFYSCSFVFV